MNVSDIQKQLKSLGFDPGPIDDILGVKTRAAIAAFQARARAGSGGIIDRATLEALFADRLKVEDAAKSSAIIRPWYNTAVKMKGLHEGRDYSKISAFLKSDGKTLGDPRSNPWCGDFVQTCIALSLPNEPRPNNPYLARNWLRFGRACEPQLGAVMVYWRGSKTGTSGHVAFYAGEAKGSYYNLGGNQKNMVSVSPLARVRLLGARWPTTISLPEKLIRPVMKGGKLSVNEE